MAESRTNFDFPAQLPIRSECADYDGFLASPRYSALDASLNERNFAGSDDVVRNNNFNGKNRRLKAFIFGENCRNVADVCLRIRTYGTYGTYVTSDIIS